MQAVSHRGLYPPSEPTSLRTLYELLTALTRAETLDQVYDAAVTSLLSATDADRASILFFDEAGVMQFRAWSGISDDYRKAVTGHTPWKPGERDTKPLVVPNMRKDESLAPYRPIFEAENIHALAFIPLSLDAGVIGKFMLYYAEPHEFTSEEISAAETIASHVALATERRRAEQARLDAIKAERFYQEANRRLAAIVESSDDAIISHDLNGRITSWNRGAEKLYGYSPEEILGKQIWILSASGHSTETDELIRRIKAGEKIEHHETIRCKKDGHLIPVSLTVSPVLDENGTLVGISKIARDITERHQAEQERTELLQMEQRARQRAELLNGIGRALSAELTVDKLIQEVTDVGTILAGAQFGAFFYNVQNAEGESYLLYALSGVPKDHFANFPMPRNTPLFEPTFRGAGPVRSDDIREDPRYGKNSPHHGIPEGHLPVRSYLAIPVASRSGEVLGGLFFGHAEPARFTKDHEDVLLGVASQAAIAIDNARLFEREQAAKAELRRSNESLRQTNRDLEAFAYSASHDLQEPLRNISISAQLLEERAGDQFQGMEAEFLKNIVRGTQRMDELLRDLLAYTTASKKAEGPVPAVEPQQVLTKLTETLQPTIASTHAAITWTKLPVIYAHPARVAQLFQNLISNALKYRSEAPPRIEISAAEENGWAIFRVRDNGIGLEPQYGEQIFGLFKRLHNRERYPGSGIGLAICQRIVEQYGGRIWLEDSAPGRGATFAFTLPLRAPGNEG